MVLKEIQFEKEGARTAAVTGNVPRVPALESRLATPIDRVAAIVADFVLFSPVMALVMAPFKRQSIEAQLAGNDEAWFIATASSIAAAAVALMLFQTLCLIKWRATPGKLLFGLRVETLFPDGDNKALNPMSAFLRSFVFCLEILMLGLPWLAILGNERRRPFHDRISDTIVISKRSRKVGPPNLSEMALSSGLMAAVFTSCALLATFKLAQMGIGGAPLAGAIATATDLESSGDLCQEVGNAERDWVPNSGEKKPDRIAVALSLYEGDAIDEECLKQEADYALWKTDSKDLAYLARGLAEKNDEELAQSYLDKSCETQNSSDACLALKLLREPEMPEDPVEAKLAGVQRENEIYEIVTGFNAASAPFLRIIAIRELTSKKEDTLALSLIESFPPQRELAFFLSTERTKALWNLDRQSEARLSLRSSISGFDPEQRIALSRWFCHTETSTIGCSANSRPACDWLASAVEDDEELLKNSEIAVTYLRGESCADRLTEKRLRHLQAKVSAEPAKNYLDALTHLAAGEREAGLLLLREVAKDSENAGPFFIEANARLVDLAGNVADLSKIRETWVDTDPAEEGWTFLGRLLMERYNELKAWDKTIEIGFKLGENDGVDRLAARSLVVAAFRAGQPNMAFGYLETFAKPRGEQLELGASRTLRRPASADGFDEIARELMLEPKHRTGR